MKRSHSVTLKPINLKHEPKIRRLNTSEFKLLPISLKAEKLLFPRKGEDPKTFIRSGTLNKSISLKTEPSCNANKVTRLLYEKYHPDHRLDVASKQVLDKFELPYKLAS